VQLTLILIGIAASDFMYYDYRTAASCLALPCWRKDWWACGSNKFNDRQPERKQYPAVRFAVCAFAAIRQDR
jgi:hypothetical protein